MVRKLLMLIVVTCLLIVSMLIPVRSRFTMGADVNPIWNAKNFVVYYNIISQAELDRIIAYDLAIINVSGVTNQILRRMKAADTLLYSYVSLVSVEKTDTYKNANMEASDYLYLEGEKLYNTQYDCFYGDILSENYQKILMKIIKERVVDPGFDGVFFDTLDDIEYLSDPELKRSQFEGYLAFYRQLKDKYPGLSVIQNRGFTLYEQGGAAYLDGLVYEDLKYDREVILESGLGRFQHLTDIAKEADNVIMAISHENRKENFEVCLNYRWLYYYKPYSNNYMYFEDTLDKVDLSQ